MGRWSKQYHRTDPNLVILECITTMTAMTGLLNLSVATAIRDFYATVEKACEGELVQLFKKGKALTPVKWDELSNEQNGKN
jgi:hypothetical protein